MGKYSTVCSKVGQTSEHSTMAQVGPIDPNWGKQDSGDKGGAVVYSLSSDLHEDRGQVSYSSLHTQYLAECLAHSR